MRAGAASAPVLTLLAADRRRVAVDLDRVVAPDTARHGSVARSPRPGVVRRAEPGPSGPLVLEARREAGEVMLEVWGPAGTPADAAEAALHAAGGWAGCDDRPGVLDDVVTGHPLLTRLLRRLGEVRLSVTPRLGEAFGRAVLGQLVQVAEARRSTAQLAALLGNPAPGGLWTWPEPARLAATPAWRLRRAGLSLRGARALHAGALADARLSEVARDHARLDRRLRALPGVGAWTSGEVRGALGDPDAVSVGDYHLPGLVGHVLGGGGGRCDWDDAGMLALLAPFTGQRGRVVRLVSMAASAGLVSRPARKAPRAPLSAHRYW